MTHFELSQHFTLIINTFLKNISTCLCLQFTSSNKYGVMFFSLTVVETSVQWINLTLDICLLSYFTFLLPKVVSCLMSSWTLSYFGFMVLNCEDKSLQLHEHDLLPWKKTFPFPAVRVSWLTGSHVMQWSKSVYTPMFCSNRSNKSSLQDKSWQLIGRMMMTSPERRGHHLVWRLCQFENVTAQRNSSSLSASLWLV